MFSDDGAFDPTYALANVAYGSGLGQNSPLMQLLMNSTAIEPGSNPGYQLCKTLYLYHPLGAVLTEAPVKRAMARERELSVPCVGEDRLVQAFKNEWGKYGDEGADDIILNLMAQSRAYGVSTLVIDDGGGADTAVNWDRVARVRDVRFHVFDPLLTAGSLVLSQDPASRDFLYPSAPVVNGVAYHPSRALIKMNEKPILYHWSSSGYGYVGRSVYQRALYPLQTYIQTMITDDMITKKAALLVMKTMSPGSVIDRMAQAVGGMKRRMLQSGMTGNVLQIGDKDTIETLNFTNAEGPYALVRMNVIKNIATSASMPASIIAQETLTEGFGEGTEDFKKEVQYLDHLRREMGPIYTFIDSVVMRRAWSREFFDALQNSESHYASYTYEAALHEWVRAFSYTWPNLMEEPDSEKAKMEEVRVKAAATFGELLLPILDSKNKVIVADWLADQANNNNLLFTGELVLDTDSLLDDLEKRSQQEEAATDADMELQAEEPAKKPRAA